MIKKFLITTCMITGAAGASLFAMRPYNKRRAIFLSRFTQPFIAHRGLFKNPEIPENSMPAFAEAVKMGYGIELDVQLTADNKLVIFHDDTLKRMCGDPRLLRELKYEELKSMRLLNGKEHIPLFRDVLKLINGKVPLVVEIKPEGRYIETVRRAVSVLKRYKGVYCIESFNPFVLVWLKKHRPEILRGQLSTDFKKDGDEHSHPLQFILSNMFFNFISRPDFIAYNYKHAGRLPCQICTKFFKSLNAAWTVQSEKDLKEAEKYFKFFIFDGFRP